jgi:4-hydroxy-4-methyl-2-oxoglutarate aldolase
MTSPTELQSMAHEASPAAVSDVLAKMGHTYQHDMRGVHQQTPGSSLFGQAVTVRSLPARPDMIDDLRRSVGGDRLRMPFDRALEATGPGRILVMDSSGHPDVTLGGGTKFSRLVATGAAGLVTDGLLRDKQELQRFGYPVYSNGFSPRSGTTHFLFPHDFDVPVTCGGALVRPGDYLIGDENGIVVVPEHIAPDVLRIAVLKEQLDTFAADRIRDEDVPAGTYFPPDEQTLTAFASSIGMRRDELPL